jgi:hypothetical protein
MIIFKYVLIALLATQNPLNLLGAIISRPSSAVLNERYDP